MARAVNDTPGAARTARGARGWAVLAARLLIGGLLLVAGVLKAADPARFVTEIERYRLIGPQLSWLAGLYVPWVEIVAGAALAGAPGWWRRAGAWWVALGLYLAFAIFIGAAWWRGLDITCGCFGGQSTSPVNALTFARSLTLLVVAAAGCWGDREPDRPPNPSAGLPTPRVS